MRLRRALVGGSVLVVLAGATTLALASRRIVAEQAAFGAPSAERCVPTRLNRSAVLAGTGLAVSPLPGSYDASGRTQISLLGTTADKLSDVSVRGSQTGSHPGRLRAYSQGDGASFVTPRPFASGETVRVRGRVRSGTRTRSFTYDFVIAHENALPPFHPTPPSGKDPGAKLHFHSRPDLEPPLLVVTARSPQAAPGDLFTAPYSGPGKPGPTIYDEAGNLIWFSPLPTGYAASNLQVQQYAGKPVLTWWQGRIPPQGFGEGEEILNDSAYRQIGRVHAGNGYKADLHDFKITAQGTGLLTIFNPVACNLSSLGGPSGGAVTDSVFQEIDIKTGLVRREWHSLDHVPLSDSYSTAVTTSTKWPFDYFHVNSIDQRANGTTLISARNTWALYELNTQTGQVQLKVGGRRSNVKLGSGAKTAYQHDATTLANGTISIFDNGAVPKVHPQSRGIVLSLSSHRRTGTVVAQYEHHGALSSGSQGNIQALAGGDMFVGWGSEPYFSEYSAGGQLLFDAHWHGSYESYRGYRFPWTGAPAQPPSIVVSKPNAKGIQTVYASWNGDTRTASWRVIAGPSPQQLAPVASATRSNFETAIPTAGPQTYLAVQALDGAGNVLGTSHTAKG